MTMLSLIRKTDPATEAARPVPLSARALVRLQDRPRAYQVDDVASGAEVTEVNVPIHQPRASLVRRVKNPPDPARPFIVRHAGRGAKFGGGMLGPRWQGYQGGTAGEYVAERPRCARCHSAPDVMVGDICAPCALRAEAPEPFGDPIATYKRGADIVDAPPDAGDAEQIAAVGPLGLFSVVGAADPWDVARTLAWALARRTPPICIMLDPAATDIRVYRARGPREWLAWWDCGPEVYL